MRQPVEPISDSLFFLIADQYRSQYAQPSKFALRAEHLLWSNTHELPATAGVCRLAEAK